MGNMHTWRQNKVAGRPLTGQTDIFALTIVLFGVADWASFV